MEKASKPPQKRLFQIGGKKYLVIELLKKCQIGICKLLKSCWANVRDLKRSLLKKTTAIVKKKVICKKDLDNSFLNM